jgi:signal transduction histidine kinase
MRIRTRLLLVVVASVALALAGLIVAFNLVLGASLSHNARDRARSRATTALGALHVVNGRLDVGEALDAGVGETPLWIFAGGRVLEAPPASPSVTAFARGFVRRGAGFFDAPNDLRLYGTPVVANGQRVGTVVAGVSLAPYEETRRTALLASLALGALVLVLVAGGARWLLGAALRPVARMTRQADAWSERDLDSRFGLGEPRDELTMLAATLDRLLDRLAASLRREQRFSAELSHELRTPLARMLTEVELALRRERTSSEYAQALRVVEQNARELARTVDALVAAARLETGGSRGTADAYRAAARSVETCSGLAVERGLDLRAVPPQRPIRVGADAELVERILQPLVENACRHGRTTVLVSVRRDGGAVRYVVRDDGAGVAAPDRERIFDPGVRGEANGGGAGLGLALARRLARSAHGDVTVASGDGGVFELRLPAA